MAELGGLVKRSLAWLRVGVAWERDRLLGLDGCWLPAHFRSLKPQLRSLRPLA